MALVGVWSDGPALLDGLRQRAAEHTFLGGCHPAELAGAPLDLLVISPTAAGLAGAGAIRARLALIPGENPALAREVRAQSAVSYGLGCRNTLTLSSLSPRRLSLALQRQVYTVSGALLDGQEWVLPRDDREHPEALLCRLGALLLLDRPPE